jgi:transposase
MDMSAVLQHLLPLGTDWGIIGVTLEGEPKRIDIKVAYEPDSYLIEGARSKIYDELPEREWQHLPWFQYRCYIKCRAPRFVNTGGQVRIVPVPWSDSRKGYTNLFLRKWSAMPYGCKNLHNPIL